MRAMNAVEIGYLISLGKMEEVEKNPDFSLGKFLAKGKLEKVLPDAYKDDAEDIRQRILILLKDNYPKRTKENKSLLDIVHRIDPNGLSNEEAFNISHLKTQLFFLIQNPRPSIEDIKSLIAGYFDLLEEEIDSKTRKRDIVEIRQIIMFFATGMGLGSLAAIGSKVGGKDHATVLHSQRVINGLIETKDKQIIGYIQDIISILLARGYFDINHFKDDRTRENIKTAIAFKF